MWKTQTIVAAYVEQKAQEIYVSKTSNQMQVGRVHSGSHMHGEHGTKGLNAPIFTWQNLSALNLALDYMHCKYLGSDQYAYGSIMWLLCFQVLPNDPLANLLALWPLIKNIYAAKGIKKYIWVLSSSMGRQTYHGWTTFPPRDAIAVSLSHDAGAAASVKNTFCANFPELKKVTWKMPIPSLQSAGRENLVEYILIGIAHLVILHAGTFLISFVIFDQCFAILRNSETLSKAWFQDTKDLSCSLKDEGDIFQMFVCQCSVALHWRFPIHVLGG